MKKKIVSRIFEEIPDTNTQRKVKSIFNNRNLKKRNDIFVKFKSVTAVTIHNFISP